MLPIRNISYRSDIGPKTVFMKFIFIFSFSIQLGAKEFSVIIMILWTVYLKLFKLLRIKRIWRLKLNCEVNLAYVPGLLS